MEEDIKILEEMMKEVKEEAISYDKYCYEVEVKQVRAIENLVKAYKELEERNSILNESNILKINKLNELEKNNERLEAKVKRYEKYLENKDKRLEEALEYEFQERERDYIPKSKVKEKIEELEHEKFKRTQLGIFQLKNYENQKLLGQIQVLRELLEE